ncbi:hypothetical protein ZIOFF_032058 [Zingiber officinale]|uniref:DM2 domain-containing protein n=1 Tax=Zingiber officinale TaxID=94328 RepID=A0A8J5GIH9_ZINOF|nr:hypothetical protein ZIOFF_032058 [Zingiber officinale]
MATAKGGSKEESAKVVAKGVVKPKGAFHWPLPLYPAMSKFLGIPEITLVDAVKKIWEHIKANQLQIVMLIQDVHNYCGKRAYEDVDESRDDKIDEDEFKEEQNYVACLIHMLYNDDLEEMLKIQRSNQMCNYYSRLNEAWVKQFNLKAMWKALMGQSGIF